MGDLTTKLPLIDRLKAASSLREEMEGTGAGWLYGQAASRIEALEAALAKIRDARFLSNEPTCEHCAVRGVREIASTALAAR